MLYSTLTRGGIVALTAGSLLLLQACGSADGTSASTTVDGEPSASAGAAQAGAKKGYSPNEGGGAESNEKSDAPISYATLLQRVTSAISRGQKARAVFGTQLDDVTLKESVEIDYTREPVALRSRGEGIGGWQGTETIIVNGELYMSMGEGQYVKSPLATVEMQAIQLGPYDPRQLLSTYAKGGAAARGLKPKQIEGRRATGYEADVSKALQPQSEDGLPDQPKKVLLRVWFDDEGLLLRVEIDRGSHGKFTLTYTGWNKNVKVAAPPASQVTEMPEMPEIPLPS